MVDKGIITNIQHYCYHDGPGIRTTVFFKGCSLKCRWCSNPENIYPAPELQFESKKCVGIEKCGKCLEELTLKNVVEVDEGKITLKKEQQRYDVSTYQLGMCYSSALSVIGEEKSVHQIVDEVMLDYPFYINSGGGITLSGGEALLQPSFSMEILKECKRQGISTAIETAGNVPWKNMNLVLPYVDTLIFDIKMISSQKHYYWTGMKNNVILDNLKKAVKSFKNISFLVRTPIIPGVNDDLNEIRDIVRFIRQFEDLVVIRYELLRYHTLGVNKYELIGRKYSLNHILPMNDEMWNAFLERIKDF